MFSWFSFSHHPLCKNFHSEVIPIKDIYLCKGCSEVYGFGFLTAIILFIINPSMNFAQIFITLIISVIPSFIGNFIHFKKRIIKDAIRIILGFGLGIWISEVLIIPDFFEKFILKFIFVGIYILFKYSRSIQNVNSTLNLCSECHNFTENACPTYKKVFKTEGDYSRILSDYIQKKLTVNKMGRFGYHDSSLGQNHEFE